MLTISYIKDFALLHANIAYILITVGMILEGEIVVIMAGIFAHLGSINIVIVVISIFIGGGIKALLGYKIGSYLQNHHSHSPFLCKVEERVNRFFPYFKENPYWSVFLARFLILSLYSFVLIFAGYKKISVRTFIKAEISSLILWSAVMLSLGYLFSYAALSFSRHISNFIGMVFIFFIGFFILEKVVSFFVRLIENK